MASATGVWGEARGRPGSGRQGRKPPPRRGGAAAGTATGTGSVAGKGAGEPHQTVVQGRHCLLPSTAPHVRAWRPSPPGSPARKHGVSSDSSALTPHIQSTPQVHLILHPNTPEALPGPPLPPAAPHRTWTEQQPRTCRSSRPGPSGPGPSGPVSVVGTQRSSRAMQENF